VIAIAPTKCDLLASSSIEPKIPMKEASALAQALGAIFVETSAKDNYGVTDLFQKVAERVLYFREKGVMDSSDITATGGNNETDGIITKDRDIAPAPNLTLLKHSHYSSSLEKLSQKEDNTVQDNDTTNTPNNTEHSTSSSALLSYTTHPPLSPLKDDRASKDMTINGSSKNNSASNTSSKKAIPISSSAASTAKMLICDASPLACGMFGNTEPSEDNAADSCIVS